MLATTIGFRTELTTLIVATDFQSSHHSSKPRVYLGRLIFERLCPTRSHPSARLRQVRSPEASGSLRFCTCRFVFQMFALNLQENCCHHLPTPEAKA